MYTTQAQLTTHQALTALEQLSAEEARQFLEGLSYLQLRNLLEAIAGAKYVLGKLERSVEQNMGWLEEAACEVHPLAYAEAA